VGQIIDEQTEFSVNIAQLA